jgi:ribonuclease D
MYKNLPSKLDMDKVIVVSKETDLNTLIDTPKEQRIFALDLEHSDHISFLGVTSLLQISFLNKDYIIDTIEGHDYIHKLKFIFEDLNTCKVIHGGASDIKWLQRDFGIYLINIFDTQIASLTLKKEDSNLDFLLQE